MNRRLFLLQLPRDGSVGSQNGNAESTDEQLRRLIRREGHGDSRKAMRVLLAENADLRAERRDLRALVDKAKTENRLAPDGGLGLSAEQRKQFEAVQKYLTDHKLTVEQLLETATKAGKLEGELSEVKLRELHDDVADSLGWNGPALGEVVSLKKLEVAMRDVTVTEDGKKVTRKIAHVRPTGDDKAPWEPLEEFASANLKTFLPSLVAKGDEDEGEGADDEADLGTDATDDETNSERRRVSREIQDKARAAQGGPQFPAQRRSKTPAGKAKSDKELREEALNSPIGTSYSSI